MFEIAQQTPTNIPNEGLVGVAIGLTIFVLLLAVISFILWVWAIIDAIYREFPSENEKVLWIIALILGFFVLGPIIPIIYLVIRRSRGHIPPPRTPARRR